MKLGWQPRKWLEKKAKRGARGHPIGTIAFYGPDDRRATKAVASVVPDPDTGATELRRWLAEDGDVRADETTFAEIAAFLRENEVHSVAMMDRIIGCPHEEGIDYPSGEPCPRCPFWSGRNRWTGEIEAE